jgi:hypothetical protein
MPTKPAASHATEVHGYFDDTALHRRSLAATVDKTWRAQGVDAGAVIREVEAHDRHAGTSLRLMQAFGLRFKESPMLRPHQDVLTAQLAGRPADGPARYLDTHRGTKGGQDRLLPIDSPQREAAVAQACRVAIGPTTASATRGARWRRPNEGCATRRNAMESPAPA